MSGPSYTGGSLESKYEMISDVGKEEESGRSVRNADVDGA